MNNAEMFRQVFNGMYASELWAMNEKEFLIWLNSEVKEEIKDPEVDKDQLTFDDILKEEGKL